MPTVETTGRELGLALHELERRLPRLELLLSQADKGGLPNRDRHGLTVTVHDLIRVFTEHLRMAFDLGPFGLKLDAERKAHAAAREAAHLAEERAKTPKQAHAGFIETMWPTVAAANAKVARDSAI